MPAGRLVIAVGGFNTSLDKLAQIDALEPGAVLRLRDVRTLPGGKGLHVACACGTLGAAVTLVGLIDEAHRALFEAAATRAGVSFVGVTVGAPIRTCLALRDATGRMTELLEPGPQIEGTVTAALLGALLREARPATYVVLSGSLPPGLPADTYATLIGTAGSDRVLLDASGAALRSGIGAAPLLVKPNREEAEAIAGFPIRNLQDAVRAAAAVGARGPRLVLLSLGQDGAVLWNDGRASHVAAPAIEARNTVGSGDCLLAGFAVALQHGWSIGECARYAVACGTAKACHPEIGVLRRADVDALLPAVTITNLSG